MLHTLEVGVSCLVNLMKTSFKLTRLEKYWILYDVGNSAFTLLIATILPIYFNYISEKAGLSSVEYLAYWGYAASITTFLILLGGPVLGSISDNKNMKKKIFLAALLIGICGCLSLGTATHWLVFLIIFVIAKTGYSCSLIFYDSMLTDVTTPERMDMVSSQGYAWGYIGSCVPFLLCLGIVLGSDKLGISMITAMGISFVIISSWWGLSALPLIKHYRQTHYVENQNHIARESFLRLIRTLQDIRKEKAIFLFLISFFFYIDGVYTIIDMATVYGAALGFDSTALLLALLLTQIVAFPCALIFGRLATKIKNHQLISVCIFAYLGISIFALFMSRQIHFWILAVLVGIFQGGIQALSRSYFAKIIPSEKSGEYFGLMDICGKGASLLGTALVSFLSQLTGSINLGVGAIAILFILGIVFFHKAVQILPEV